MKSKIIFKSIFANNPIKTNIALGLKDKFILALLALVILPLLVTGIIAYRQSSKIIKHDVYTYTLDTMKQASKNIDYYIKEMERITEFLTTSDELLSYLESYNSMSDLDKVETANKINKILLNFTGFRSELSGLYLFDSYGNSFYRKGRSPKLDYDYKSEQWYTDTLEKSGKINIIGTHLQYHVQYKPVNVISVSRLVRNFLTREPIGVIMVDYNYSVIDRIINSEASLALTTGNLYILDKDGKIIFNHDPSVLSKDFNYDFPKETFTQKYGIFTQRINGNEMFVVFYTSPYSTWKIVNIVPLNYILKDITVIKNSIIIVTLICIALIFILSLEVSNSLVKPIKSLVSAMSQVENGNLSASIEINTGDEIQLLADSFNRMSKNIKNLIEKVYQAQLSQKEAQLKELQTQINPHFLYNTLESIRGVAMVEGIPSIALMSKSLSSLFRYSIKGNEIVTIRDEIDHIKNYINIQNFRFENKFLVEYDIDEVLYDYKILKLTLQPLVENSIHHGLESKRGKGKISISCEKINDNIRFLITDNGTGIPEDKLELLNQSLSREIEPITDLSDDSNKSQSIGVANVNSRLKLYLGNEYGLRFTSINGKGTTVEILIPAVKEL